MTRIFYMNQGVKSSISYAVNYTAYDVLLIAESAEVKQHFEIAWSSTDSLPIMSVQVRKAPETAAAAATASIATTKAFRLAGLDDLDTIFTTVRPIVTFTCPEGFRVIFVHLKSGSVTQATDALTLAWGNVLKKSNKDRILWVGDFNRAIGLAGGVELTTGGGYAHWDLDRVIMTGGTAWKGYSVAAGIVATAGADHGHVGIGIQVVRTIHKKETTWLSGFEKLVRDF